MLLLLAQLLNDEVPPDLSIRLDDRTAAALRGSMEQRDPARRAAEAAAIPLCPGRRPRGGRLAPPRVTPNSAGGRGADGSGLPLRRPRFGFDT